MAIQLGVCLVASIGSMELKLVYAVGVIIAGVALDLHRIRQRGVFQAPFVRFAALSDVIDQLKTLQVFVGFAVELRYLGNIKTG